MNYDQAIHFLYHQLPMYQRAGAAAYKDNLDNTIALDKMFHHPHESFKSIHVAGTNGKGSVSHQLASVLQSAGYKVGLYTSPHLKDYRERIKVNGQMIQEESVIDFLDRFFELNEPVNLQPSFFELTVMMAFHYFAKQEVDVAVIEVGLGGRLDSTNIIRPDLSIITNISLDHTNLLGNTIALIAAEKSGIIKRNVPVVIGETQLLSKPVFENKAHMEGSSLIFADEKYTLQGDLNKLTIVDSNDNLLYENIELDLGGNYQQKNVITCVASIELLNELGYKLSSRSVVHGLKNVVRQTGLLGRWQKICESPDVICDTAHNEAGLEWVAKQLQALQYQQLHIVFGTVNDKDISKILALLPRNALYYFTQAKIERAFPANKLCALAVNFNLKGNTFNSVEEAYEAALKNASNNDLIFIGGSTFVVAEII